MKPYAHWTEVQNVHDDYVTSFAFDTLEEVAAYLKKEYGFSHEQVRKLTVLEFAENETVRIILSGR